MELIIPAFNEASVIQRAIWSALTAGFKQNKIHVVDDGSTDKTADIAEAMGVQVWRQFNHGKAAAVRTGLSHITATWVCILDADCVMHVDYRREILKAIRQRPGAALISGNQRSQRGNWLTAWRSVEHAVCGGIYRASQDLTGTIAVVPGLCSVFRTAVFAR